METYSVEHSLFLRKKKKEKKLILLFQFLLLFTFLMMWEVLSHFEIINSFLYSSPSRIIKILLSLLTTGKLIYPIGITLFEIMISFILSTIFGFLVAGILWISPFLSRVFDPYLNVLNSLPKVALGPLIIIWLGAKIPSIIFMSLLISLFVTIISFYQGFIHVDSTLITMAKSFGASKRQIFFKIILPVNHSQILSTLKVNLSMNLIGVIMGELLVSKAGIGYLIMYGSQVFHLDLVLSCIILLSLLSYGLYFCIQKIK